MQQASSSNYGVLGVAAVSLLGPWGVMRDARCAARDSARARHDDTRGISADCARIVRSWNLHFLKSHFSS